jgi:hypothetical protein
VIANVVGQVSIGKLIKIASRMGKMPKDLLHHAFRDDARD